MNDFVQAANDEPTLILPVEDVIGPETDLHGRTIRVDGNITMGELAQVLAAAGFMLYNDGTGRIVAKAVPAFIRAEATNGR